MKRRSLKHGSTPKSGTASEKCLEDVWQKIENKIRAYVRKEFGETSELLKEFNGYSFFPNDFVVNSFNIIENQYWHGGKCHFLYFIDKLTTVP